MESPPRKFFRLAPGREVRLKHAYFITCDQVVKDGSGGIVELRCTYDPATGGGAAPDGRSPKATLHWVSVGHAIEAEIRDYDTLFLDANPGRKKADSDFLKTLNPDSLTIVTGAKLEPSLASAGTDEPVQFLRKGYYVRDTHAEGLVFNRTVTLKDGWAREQAKGG